MRYITTPQRGDGFGATFHHIIYDILYAKNNGDIYIFTPQMNYEHNYNNKDDFIERLNAYMGLAELYPKPEGEIHIESYKREDVYKFVENNFEKLFLTEEFEKIKTAFFKNKANPLNQNFFNICIHIRRPNSHDTSIFGSNTPLIYYERAMNYIKSYYTYEKPIKFHIISQGALLKEELNIFSEYNPEYHIDKEILESFTILVYSDVLVNSLSCFSRTASFLTKGKVINNLVWMLSGVSNSPPWWNPFYIETIF